MCFPADQASFVSGAFSNAGRNALRCADLEILPAHVKLIGADFLFERIHRARRRPGDLLTLRIENAAVAEAEELIVIRMSIDGTTRLRAARGHHRNAPRALCRAARIPTFCLQSDFDTSTLLFSQY
jgi:hypothetical protein